MVTDRRTNGRTDKASYRDARTHLKTKFYPSQVNIAQVVPLIFIFRLILANSSQFWGNLDGRGLEESMHASYYVQMSLYNEILGPRLKH